MLKTQRNFNKKHLRNDAAWLEYRCCDCKPNSSTLVAKNKHVGANKNGSMHFNEYFE